MREELYAIILQGDDVQAVDVHHVVPDEHLLAQETLQYAVSQEYCLQIEVGANHHVRHHHVLRNDRHLVATQFHTPAVHLCLYLTAGADNNGVHGYMSSLDFGKLLDAVHYHDIFVGVADLDVFIVG